MIKAVAVSTQGRHAARVPFSYGNCSTSPALEGNTMATRTTASASASLRAADAAPRAETADWLQLIRSEYLEIPGLHLTRSQVQRLWGLDAPTCDALLAALIEGRFLRRTDAGAYVRADSGR
jgi:hypothetical protein